MWMGIIWIGLGLFFLIQGGFLLPRINIELGWVVLALGILRLVGWWFVTEKPRREREERRQGTQALLQEELEALEEEERSARDS